MEPFGQKMRRITALETIQVMLADDNREFTQLLTEYVEQQDDMEVIGSRTTEKKFWR